MERSAELFGRRRVRIVATEVGVVGFVAIRAPVALELAGIGIDNCHTFVEVAVCYVGFVSLRVNEDFGHSPEIIGVVAAGGLALVAELREELAVLSELQDMGVVRAVVADPDIAFVIYGDSVVRLCPLVDLYMS